MENAAAATVRYNFGTPEETGLRLTRIRRLRV